jgi:hypothetical protein
LHSGLIVNELLTIHIRTSRHFGEKVMRRSYLCRLLYNNRLLALAAALTTVSFALVPFPAAAESNSFELLHINATVSGTSVTAATTVAAASSTRADYFGVCARTQSGGNADFWMRPATITPDGTTSQPDTKSFPAGTYTYFPCLYVDGAWRNISGGSKTFTVSTSSAADSSADSETGATSETLRTDSFRETASSAIQPKEQSESFTETTSSAIQPKGQSGWNLAFADEFGGTSLDTSRWAALDGTTMNKVTTRASNVAVTNGHLVLTLSSASNGAMVSSARSDGAGSNGYLLPTRAFAEARVFFPGSSSGRCYNWPAWWASGPRWPAAGEHDIAEVLSGSLTVDYHSTSGAHNQGAVPGDWCNAWHVYGVHRKAASTDIYWDGKLVKSYSTDDNNSAESLLLNIGVHSSNTVTGSAGALRVDYVRAWE